MKKILLKIKALFQKNKAKMQDPNYVTKLYKRSQAELLIAVFAFLTLYFFNYGYTMLKVKLVNNYIYTQTLDNEAKEHLGEKLSLGNFDYLTIGLYQEKLVKEDPYFHLFAAGTYKNEVKDFKNAHKTTEILAEGKTGTVSFNIFADSAINKIKKEKDKLTNCDKIIIDLRNNTGGDVKSAVELADMFLDKGKVVYGMESKKKYKTIKSRGSAVLTPQKIIILQNKWTASSAELFIMALKENLDNVTVVGTTSYGKGVAQSEYPLPGGYAFKFTSARLKTPSGGSIHGTGIKPDITYDKDDILEYAKSL